MNGGSQVITEVEFICTAAVQGAHHVINLILLTSPPSKERTSLPCGVYMIQTRLLLTPLRCVTHYFKNPPHSINIQYYASSHQTAIIFSVANGLCSNHAQLSRFNYYVSTWLCHAFEEFYDRTAYKSASSIVRKAESLILL